jgi:ARP2/3 complex 16 kDa subunit (p16-Arc)
VVANMFKQDLHLQTVTEVLQSIKASEMTPMLQRIFQTEGGGEILDVLMKYLFVFPTQSNPPPPLPSYQANNRLTETIDTKAWPPLPRPPHHQQQHEPQHAAQPSHHSPQTQASPNMAVDRAGGTRVVVRR